MMAAKDRAATHERDRQRFEAQGLGIDAKRRAAKPTVTREQVDTLMNVLSPEDRAHVAMLATIKAGLRPATWPR
jgi:hypothetical protein